MILQSTTYFLMIKIVIRETPEEFWIRFSV